MRFLQVDDFGGRLNETFDLSLGEATVPLTLVDIQRLPVVVYPGRTRDPFSLVFLGSSPIAMPQRLYRLVNTVMGDMEIFLVPVGMQSGGTLYQAVFN